MACKLSLHQLRAMVAQIERTVGSHENRPGTGRNVRELQKAQARLDNYRIELERAEARDREAAAKAHAAAAIEDTQTEIAKQRTHAAAVYLADQDRPLTRTDESVRTGIHGAVAKLAARAECPKCEGGGTITHDQHGRRIPAHKCGACNGSGLTPPAPTAPQPAAQLAQAAADLDTDAEPDDCNGQDLEPDPDPDPLTVTALRAAMVPIQADADAKLAARIAAPCPQCHAEPGQPCTNYKGQRCHPHGARKAAPLSPDAALAAVKRIMADPPTVTLPPTQAERRMSIVPPPPAIHCSAHLPSGAQCGALAAHALMTDYPTCAKHTHPDDRPVPPAPAATPAAAPGRRAGHDRKPYHTDPDELAPHLRNAAFQAAHETARRGLSGQKDGPGRVTECDPELAVKMRALLDRYSLGIVLDQAWAAEHERDADAKARRIAQERQA